MSYKIEIQLCLTVFELRSITLLLNYKQYFSIHELEISRKQNSGMYTDIRWERTFIDFKNGFKSNMYIKFCHIFVVFCFIFFRIKKNDIVLSATIQCSLGSLHIITILNNFKLTSKKKMCRILLYSHRDEKYFSEDK